MRAVIQRVSRASARINGEAVGKVEHGLMILLGVEKEDDRDQACWLAKKISGMRLFDDAEGVPNLSVIDVSGGLLVVSQFTLAASTKKGTRPSFQKAARPEVAEPLYEFFMEELERESGRPVECGRFGAMMEVELINDGPFTIIVDSLNRI